MAYQFRNYDPIASFERGHPDDSFRLADGSDIFSSGAWLSRSDDSDINVLRKIAFRAVAGLVRLKDNESLADSLLTWLRFVDEYRERLAEGLSTRLIKVVVCDSSGARLPHDEAIEAVLESDDFDLVNVTASLAKGTSEPLEPSIAMMYYVVALKKVDEAILSVMCGGNGTACHAVVALESLKAGEALENYSDTKRQTFSDWGRRARAKSLEVDPRQKEKLFIRDCWSEWQKQPSNYRSKAAFAKDVIEKCQFLVSTKVVENWCREWSKSEANPLNE
jgi:hypothetical protein